MPTKLSKPSQFKLPDCRGSRAGKPHVFVPLALSLRCRIWSDSLGMSNITYNAP